MIADLERAGISRGEIERQTNLSRSTIWRLVNGGNRDHMAGTVEKVGALH